MSVKSKGRGTAAVFGLLLLLAGVIGAVVLYVLAEGRPEQAVDDFARAPIGCTTTLEFSETGTFFVYEESGGEILLPEGGCVPVADPLSDFRFELARDGQAVVPRRDDSIAYDVSGRTGQSVARVEIDETGTYEIAVRGSDLTVVAAIGRDPDEGVGNLQRGAIAVGAAGVVLGLLLLLLAGRRSKQAATVAAPVAPAAVDGSSWPPAPPTVPDVPLVPAHLHEQAEAAVAHDPEPLPLRRPPAAEVSPWAAPSAEDVADEAPPEPATNFAPPLPTPELPDEPGDEADTSPPQRGN